MRYHANVAVYCCYHDCYYYLSFGPWAEVLTGNSAKTCFHRCRSVSLRSEMRDAHPRGWVSSTEEVLWRPPLPLFPHEHRRAPGWTGGTHCFSEAEFLQLFQPLAQCFLQSFLPGFQGRQHVFLGWLRAIRFLRTCQLTAGLLGQLTKGCTSGPQRNWTKAHTVDVGFTPGIKGVWNKTGAWDSKLEEQLLSTLGNLQLVRKTGREMYMLEREVSLPWLS